MEDTDEAILNTYIKYLEKELDDMRFRLRLYEMRESFWDMYLKSRDNDKADYITENETVKGQNE